MVHITSGKDINDTCSSKSDATLISDGDSKGEENYTSDAHVSKAKSIRHVEVTKIAEGITTFEDSVSIEEPLEIRLEITSDSEVRLHQVAVTMRTPGNDKELAIGFLFTEGIISSPSDIEDIDADKCNIVKVTLQKNVSVDAKTFDRHSFVASSCGVCGKKSIAAVRVKRLHSCLHEVPTIPTKIVKQLPALLSNEQSNFKATGGIHASCIFDSDANLLNIKEDVGRHNALDKLIGSEFLAGKIPLNDRILLVSGRASFELVQKAAHAGIPILAAVGAPSSLAVQLAEECDMTLIGFLRDDRFNIYAGKHRIIEASN